MQYINIGLGDIGLALMLVGITLAVSLWQRLDLHRDLFIGTLRTFIQLTAVGYLLQVIFNLDRWYLVVLALGIMLLVAAANAFHRQQERWPELFVIMLLAIALGGIITLAIVIGIVLKVKPWYQPQYIIPIAGMIVGNAMIGAALAINRLTGEINAHREEIEAALSLGATAYLAVLPYLRSALRAAMLPTISTMMTVGIVQLPGMMSGQIIAGASPAAAVRYQVVVTYMVAAATALTTITATLLAYRYYFTPNHQLKPPSQR
ncbi:ABC transporter permease [Neomoorella thermoacetica]|uniref:Iron export permease protein FetB n=2 Tax=Neomoorella thermoacetica TaxID=1525 RepID=Q2RJA4_MOOTA|nr:iron export ABC transporter permease subunit FetB [Moorella thermoacetica]AKX93939.1 putative iron export permease protein FetB [Moorella thermoacetica]AKX96580.1 putative iron export permease protein FetB [Moorella thermoacetica]APC08334.1 putative iron export permease protein FetB [Moorella thermoacetica]OIQ09364.1 putative iron export permease protein FetB [Moorella thermoacetica]OIQ56309.1 putative iron export permease protein FetB [Moorella thermoacetica]